MSEHDPYALTVLRAQKSWTGAPEVMTKTYSISASRMVVIKRYNDRMLFASAPCHIVSGDLDALKIPSHMSVTADPGEVVAWIPGKLVHAIPELEEELA